MTETNDAPETDTSTTTKPTDETSEKPEIDWKSHARDWEKKAKANADAATKLEALEESQKSETQKLADAKIAAETDATNARAEALRWRIAAKNGISDEDAELFLSGTDEATLTKQAERLSERVAQNKGGGNVVPREGNTLPAANTNGDPAAEFAKFMSQPTNG